MLKSKSELLAFLITLHRQYAKLGDQKMLIRFADALAPHLIQPEPKIEPKKVGGRNR